MAGGRRALCILLAACLPQLAHAATPTASVAANSPQLANPNPNPNPPQPTNELSNLSLHEGYSPTYALPDVGTFDALLLDLARAPDGKPHGMTASSASLAVRAGAPQLAPAGTPQDLSLLRGPALEAPLGALPGGRSLFDVLAPNDPRPERFKVRDLGHLVLADDGPLARTARAAFGGGSAKEIAGGVVLAGVTGVAMGALGTGQAQGLGLNPGVHFTLGNGALEQGVAFRCDPHFKNPGIDIADRIHLIHLGTQRSSAIVRDAFLEGGFTAMRNTGNGVLPQKLVKLHLQNALVDTAIGWVDPAGARPFIQLEGSGNVSVLRLHGWVTREQGTGALGAAVAGLRQFGFAQTGIFFGGHDGNGITAGVLAMSVF